MAFFQMLFSQFTSLIISPVSFRWRREAFVILFLDGLNELASIHSTGLAPSLSPK
jgi:hypothetical protein